MNCTSYRRPILHTHENAVQKKTKQMVYIAQTTVLVLAVDVDTTVLASVVDVDVDASGCDDDML
jgi:hypothetical protein